MHFTLLASLKDLQTRKLICVKTSAYRILFALEEGKIYALDDMCRHEEASLSKGSPHADYVKCPQHGSRFQLVTGEALDEPDEQALTIYATESEDVSAAVDAEAVAELASKAALMMHRYIQQQLHCGI